VVPTSGSHEIIAYYAIEPDPVELAHSGSVCEDGVLYLTLLATDKRYQGQGWGERMLLRIIHQIVALAPSTGAGWLVTDALDADAQGYLLSRGFGFQLVPPPCRRLAVSVDTLRELVPEA
jgi:ribosomal protein S18 acetylase RimI-like enzyme